MTFEYNDLELQHKVQASLIPNKVQAEVFKRLDWYRTQLWLARSEINDLKRTRIEELDAIRSTVNTFINETT